MGANTSLPSSYEPPIGTLHEVRERLQVLETHRNAARSSRIVVTNNTEFPLSILAENSEHGFFFYQPNHHQDHVRPGQSIGWLHSEVKGSILGSRGYITLSHQNVHAILAFSVPGAGQCSAGVGFRTPSPQRGVQAMTPCVRDVKQFCTHEFEATPAAAARKTFCQTWKEMSVYATFGNRSCNEFHFRFEPPPTGATSYRIPELAPVNGASSMFMPALYELRKRRSPIRRVAAHTATVGRQVQTNSMSILRYLKGHPCYRRDESAQRIKHALTLIAMGFLALVATAAFLSLVVLGGPPTAVGVAAFISEKLAFLGKALAASIGNWIAAAYSAMHLPQAIAAVLKGIEIPAAVLSIAKSSSLGCAVATSMETVSQVTSVSGGSSPNWGRFLKSSYRGALIGLFVGAFSSYGPLAVEAAVAAMLGLKTVQHSLHNTIHALSGPLFHSGSEMAGHTFVAAIEGHAIGPEELLKEGAKGLTVGALTDTLPVIAQGLDFA